MTIQEFAAMMDRWRQECADQAAAAMKNRACVLNLRYGEGVSETVVRLAAALGVKKTAVLAPMSAHAGTARGISAALEALGLEGSVRSFKGRDGGGEACQAALRDISGKYLFCLLAPNQVSGAGGWCSARRESPFGLVVADICEMYANQSSERSIGLAAVAGNGAALAGIAHDASAVQAMVAAKGPWEDAALVRPPMPEENERSGADGDAESA